MEKNKLIKLIIGISIGIVFALCAVRVTQFTLDSQKANRNRVYDNIVAYTEQMEVYDYGETDDYGFEYFGNATIVLKQDNDTAIIATRVNINKKNELMSFAFFGDMVEEEGTTSFTIDEMALLSYDTKTKKAYQISLESVEDITINDLDKYLSTLRYYIFYDEIKSALDTIIVNKQLA